MLTQGRVGCAVTPKNLNLSEKRLETEEVGRGGKNVEREEVVKKIMKSNGGIGRKEKKWREKAGKREEEEQRVVGVKERQQGG